MMHRELAYKRILDAWAKFAVSNPEIDFYLSDSPETLHAEKLVSESILEYEKGAPLSIVRDAFNKWKQAWIDNSQPKTLFGLSSTYSYD